MKREIYIMNQMNVQPKTRFDALLQRSNLVKEKKKVFNSTNTQSQNKPSNIYNALIEETGSNVSKSTQEIKEIKGTEEIKEKEGPFFLAQPTGPPVPDRFGVFSSERYQSRTYNSKVCDEGPPISNRPSRFDMVRANPELARKKEEFSSTNQRRNIGIFDKITNKQNEEREDRIERNSHMKFRKNTTATSEFEVYTGKTYQKSVDINSTEEFPTLEGQVQPVKAPVKWNFIVKKD